MVTMREGLLLGLEGSKQLGEGMSAYGKHQGLIKGAEAIRAEADEGWQGGAQGKEQAAQMYRHDKESEAQKLRVQPETMDMDSYWVQLMKQGKMKEADVVLKAMKAAKQSSGGGSSWGGRIPMDSVVSSTLNLGHVDFSTMPKEVVDSQKLKTTEGVAEIAEKTGEPSWLGKAGGWVAEQVGEPTAAETIRNSTKAETKRVAMPELDIMKRNILNLNAKVDSGAATPEEQATYRRALEGRNEAIYNWASSPDRGGDKFRLWAAENPDQLPEFYKYFWDVLNSANPYDKAPEGFTFANIPIKIPVSGTRYMPKGGIKSKSKSTPSAGKKYVYDPTSGVSK